MNHDFYYYISKLSRRSLNRNGNLQAIITELRWDRATRTMLGQPAVSKQKFSSSNRIPRRRSTSSPCEGENLNGEGVECFREKEHCGVLDFRESPFLPCGGAKFLPNAEKM